jgi:hypothetical protein
MMLMTAISRGLGILIRKELSRDFAIFLELVCASLEKRQIQNRKLSKGRQFDLSFPSFPQMRFGKANSGLAMLSL